MNCAVKDSMCQFFASQNIYVWGAFLALLIILILLRKRQPKSIVAYKTENGDVTISRSAIVELVRTSCEQLDQISKPKLKVFTRKGLIHFTVYIQLKIRGNLKEIEELLQNHLRENLSKNLGIEKLGNINIFVTNLRSNRIRTVKDNSLPKVQTPPTQTEEDLDSDQTNDEPGSDQDKS